MSRRPGARFACVLAAAASPALLPPATGLAAGRSVSIIGFEYAPSPLTVGVGDTVAWKNEGFITHTVTAENGAFDSGTLLGGASFAFKFTEPGDFKYRCTIHLQMRGEVIVKSDGAMGHHTPMPMPMPTPMPPEPQAPRPGMGASGPVAISLRLSHPRRRTHNTTTIAIRTTRPGAKILLELYSREHFSWRQVAHAKADASGKALLRMRFNVRLPLRVVVPGAQGAPPSVSAVVRS